jgi:enamine deaminase RidA (YjgF/YER057c/UK114 family)
LPWPNPERWYEATAIVFANLQVALQAHGADFGNAVRATLFVTRTALAHEVVAVRQRYYGKSRPASTLVGVAALNDPHWLLEVELVAALPEGTLDFSLNRATLPER